MPIDFPTTPYIGQPYTYNNKTWEWNGQAWIVVTASGTNISRYVYAVNGITGEVGITSGTGISISQSGKTLTIINTGTSTSSGISGDYVKFINGLTGGITFFAGTGMSLNFSSAGITFTSTIPSIANTFTQLQSFNAGISASGATFYGDLKLQYPGSLAGSTLSYFKIMQNLGLGGSEIITGTGDLYITVSDPGDGNIVIQTDSLGVYKHQIAENSKLRHNSLILNANGPGITGYIGQYSDTLYIGRIVKELITYDPLITFDMSNNRINIDAANVYIPNLRNHVKTINGLSGGITLIGDNGILITEGPGNITIKSPVFDYVRLLNGLSGGITLYGSNEIAVNTSINGITFDLVLVDGGVY